MPEPTMMVSMAASLIDFAVARGADRTSLVDACGLTDGELGNPDGRIPATGYRALIRAAVVGTGDSGIAMRHAANSALDRLSIVGLIIQAAGPLEDAIRHLNTYVRIIADFPTQDGRDRFELRREDGDLWLIDHLPGANVAPIAIEETFADLVGGFRKANPDIAFVRQVQVSFPAPRHRALYDEVFEAPTRFSAGRNAILLNPAWLEAQALASKPYAFGVFARHADALLADLGAMDSARALVEAQMLPNLHTGIASMEDVARTLGMSRQTLYRRLKADGVTFAEVQDDLRQRMARDYIATRKIAVSEVAYLLGFSEASAFARAFRRWTRQSPSAYREAQGM